MSSGSTWARTHGRVRVDAESGAPTHREAPDDEHVQLVSHGGRSTIPRPQPSAADWLRYGDGSGGVWETTVSEGSE